jgi:type 1 glutamine amidotransferase
MNRREMILRTGATALGLGLTGWNLTAAARPKTKKVLFFSKSSGFEHSVIKRKDGEPSFAENILTELGPKHGIDFTFSKDGSLFTPEYLAKFDAYFFYTTGLLTEPGTDKSPPMTPAGKAAFLDAIKNGKGFIGTHSATDTFHTNEGPDANTKDRSARYQNYGEEADPYVRMIGAEFIIHGKQQNGKMRLADPSFPGFKGYGEGFELMEEWYSLKDFSKNLHVLLTQETEGMDGEPYQRPPYPATWARMHGKGRVFYTSMGHREDVWTSSRFQEMLFGGIVWAVGNVDADITPNLDKVTPQHAELPPPMPGSPGAPKKAATTAGQKP